MNRHFLQLYKDKLKTLLKKTKVNRRRKRRKTNNHVETKHLLYAKVNELTSNQ